MGTTVGMAVGTVDGFPEGPMDGTKDGTKDGTIDGTKDGTKDGNPEGTALGASVAFLDFLVEEEEEELGRKADLVLVALDLSDLADLALEAPFLLEEEVVADSLLSFDESPLDFLDDFLDFLEDFFILRCPTSATRSKERVEESSEDGSSWFPVTEFKEERVTMVMIMDRFLQIIVNGCFKKN